MNNFWKTFFAALLAFIVGFIIHFFLIFLLIGGLISAASTETKPLIHNNSLLKIDLSTITLGERSESNMSNMDIISLAMGQTGGPTIGIYDAVEAIKSAATDPKIKMIYIYSDYSIQSGIAQLEELRDAIAKFRESGKPVVSYGMNYTLGSYYLASVAGKVYMNEAGNAMINGLGGNMLFYKDLIDRLGLNVQLIRHGKFKAAAEQYIASNISDENREQNEVLLNSIWNVFGTAISTSRSIPIDSLNSKLDNLELHDAKSMKEAKLVDEIFSPNQFYEKIKDLMEVSSEKDYNIISLLTYSDALIRKAKKSDKIAILYGDGEITMKGVAGMAAQSFIADIEKIKKDDKIKAVVFRVNSPGGDAQAAELIRSELEQLRKVKPVVVSFGEYAASGGYWVSAECDKIFSDKTTVTGSIGVFSLAISYGNALKKNLNINNATIGTHKHAAMSSGVNPLSSEEIEYFQKSVENVYTQFTDLVANGRKVSKEYVDSIGQGRVWSGADGLNIKLVDQIGGLNDALEYAANLIEDDSKAADYKIVQYPLIKTDLESFMELINGKSNERLIKSLIESYKENMQGVHIYARTPYIYKFNY